MGSPLHLEIIIFNIVVIYKNRLFSVRLLFFREISPSQRFVFSSFFFIHYAKYFYLFFFSEDNKYIFIYTYVIVVTYESTLSNVNVLFMDMFDFFC